MGRVYKRKCNWMITEDGKKHRIEYCYMHLIDRPNVIITFRCKGIWYKYIQGIERTEPPMGVSRPPFLHQSFSFYRLSTDVSANHERVFCTNPALTYGWYVDQTIDRIEVIDPLQ